MENTTNSEAKMTKQTLIQQAEKLEQEADNLYIAILAPSMRERSLREDAKELRTQAESLNA